MTERHITMSKKEVDCLRVVEAVTDKRQDQKVAARQ